MLVLGSLNMNKPKNQSMADILNNVVTIKVFIISVLNIIVSSFGIEHVVQEEARYAKAAQLRMSETVTLEPSYSHYGGGGGGKVSFDENRL